MGANGSTYEEDDETITVMKGVRLTENVINRMRGVSMAASTQSAPTIPVPSLHAKTRADLLPLPVPREPATLPSADPASTHPPSVEPAPSLLSVESALPPSMDPAPPFPHLSFVEPAPPPPFVEPTPLSRLPPVEPAPPSHPLSVEPTPSAPLLPSVEPAPPPLPPSVEPAPPPLPPSVEPAPPLLPPTVKTASPLYLPCLEPAPPPPPPLFVEPAPPSPPVPVVLVSPTACPAVTEEGQCRTITQEHTLQKGLEQHMSLTELEVYQRVEVEKMQTQVGERIEEENLKQAILTDRAAAQDHRLQAHLYAHQLDQRDKQLKKQDTLYREQVTKLEERGKRFYSAITESYQKASWEVSAKFRHYQINPVCADLQREVLKVLQGELRADTLLLPNRFSLPAVCQ